MDLATRKYNFIQKVFEVNETVFEELEKIISKNDLVESISLKEYNNELDQANLRVEEGDFHTAEEVEKITSQW